MISDLSLLIEKFDVISFDIFDTLLVRNYAKPRDVWKEVERRHFAFGFAKLRSRANGLSYCDARIVEPNIDDAYGKMMFYRWLKDEELKVENEGLKANPEMLAVWKRVGALGKKRVIVSDMYLPQTFLEKILKRVGYDGWNGIYVSCEHQASKRKGDLYKLMLKELGVTPDRVLHIGDNQEADVEMPKGLGMQSYYYKPMVKTFIEANPFADCFLRRNCSIEASKLVVAMAKIWQGLEQPINYWQRIGVVFGAVLAKLYLGFVVKEAKRRQIERLLFVARDGYSLIKMFDALDMGIKTTYIYAPRLVLRSDAEQVKKEYAKYIESLNIVEERVAVVDTCSMKFTCQKLLNEVLGRDVFGIFLLTFKPVKNGVAMIFDPETLARWFNIAELVFSAPNPPIARVEDGEPVYVDSIGESEKYRIEHYPCLSESMIAAVHHLLAEDVIVTKRIWIDWIESFMACMTDEDKLEFSKSSHSPDAAHSENAPVFMLPRKKNLLFFVVAVYHIFKYGPKSYFL